MIDISTALQNILKAVYGRDVRESIHDAIFQINANANEAIDLAQIKFGTAVNSPTDPITGYAENSVYLNVNTGIMWRLEGGSWVKKGTFKSIDSISLTSTSGLIDTYTITFTDGSTSNYNVKNGADGTDGVSIVNVTKTTTSGNVDHYEINLSDGTTTPSGIDVTNGSDGKSIANITLASTVGNVKNYDVMLDDGTKTPTGFSVSDGTSSYVHVRYSANFDGTGMVTVPTDATVYIGIVVTSQSVAPTDPSVYSWVRFIGKSGTGSGDMLKADYSTKYAGVVDKAAALYDGTNEIQANQLMDKTVYDADNDGIVDEAAHATTADKVGNADTSVLEAFNSQSDGLHYHSNRILYDVDLLFNAYNANQFKIIQQGNNGRLELADPVTTKLSKLDENGQISADAVKSGTTAKSNTELTETLSNNADWLKSKELFDKSLLIKGGLFRPDGSIEPNDVMGYEYIEVEGDVTYLNTCYDLNWDYANCCWFDSDKNFISKAFDRYGETRKIVTAPSNAKYIGVSVNTAPVDTDAFSFSKYNKSNIELTNDISQLGNIELILDSAQEFSISDTILNLNKNIHNFRELLIRPYGSTNDYTNDTAVSQIIPVSYLDLRTANRVNIIADTLKGGVVIKTSDTSISYASLSKNYNIYGIKVYGIK